MNIINLKNIFNINIKYLAFIIFFCGLQVIIITNGVADYEVYRYLYEDNGGYLRATNRDPIFVIFISIFSYIFSYEEFRLWIAIYFCICTIALLRHFKKINPFDLLTILTLFHIFLYKFGIQLREGLALSVWMIYLSIFEKQPNITSFKFIFACLLSGLIHLGVIPIWIATAICNLKATSFEKKILIIGAFFFVLAIIISGVIDVELVNAVAIPRPGDQYLSFTVQKALYWSIFPIFTIFAYFNLTNFILPEQANNGGIFGVIAIGGIIGISTAVLMLTIFSIPIPLTSASNLLRYESLLVSFLAFQISLGNNRPKLIIWIVIIFIICDSIRVLYPNIYTIDKILKYA